MTFEDIYDEHKGMVYNLALQYVQNSEDAEEITQDVFVSIYQSYAEFNKRSKLSTWIYRIAINQSLDFIKAKKRKKRFAFITSLFMEDSNEVKYEQAAFDHPGVRLEDKEAIKAIFRHINKLPDSQKTALILQKIEDKSQKEVAAIMEISPKAVESLVQRAKANLSKLMKQSEGL